MWMTWANLLTLCRLALATPCALAVADGHWLPAGTLFAAAIVTDLLDGPLARRFRQSTPLGGLLDHATDAAFVSAVLAAFAYRGVLPWLLPALVGVAFVQYALDSRALRGRPLRASWLGRWNGIAYFVLAGLLLAQHALDMAWPDDRLWTGLAWLLIGSTLISMTHRAVAWYRAERSAAARRTPRAG
jgi:phosphatidylglycerophosphate synthase